MDMDSECLPSFYHPNLTDMDMVIEVLKPYTHVNGAFLLRNSFSNREVLTISVISYVFICSHECSIKHFQILLVPQPLGRLYILNREFQTLEDLVNYYGQCDVPNIEAIAGVRLTFPIAYLADDVVSLCDGTSDHQRTPRRVSASDANRGHGTRERSCTESSTDEGRHVLRHSMSESQSDDQLLSKGSTSWRQKFFPTFNKNKKVKADTQNRMVPSLSSQASCEVDSNADASGGCLAETPKKYSKQPEVPDDSIDPAVPGIRRNLPDGADALAAAAANYGTADVDAGLYYSEPRDVDRELSTNLIAHLLQHDAEDPVPDDKCVCGLYLADSELPRGWSMHKSTERGTEGRLFFTSPTGETSWELPTIVSVDLDAQQQDRIRMMLEGQNSARGNSSQQSSFSHQFLDGDKRISV